MSNLYSSLLKYLDSLPKDIVIIATTNLYEHFDKALTRRFDALINFDRYTQSDLLEIG
ncbi:MAG: AAA family ATPase [Succinivibrio sp.]